MNHKSKLEKFKSIESQLDNAISGFKKSYQDLSTFILPRRTRFFASQSKGDRRNQKILDSTATIASRTFQSGLMTGVTSPASAWHKTKSDQGEINKLPQVKSYFNQVDEIIRDHFLKSNLYNVLPTVYGDLGTFGTGCLYMEEDLETGVTFYNFPIGSYKISSNEKGKVRLFHREFQMSVRQIVDKFGKIDPENEIKIDWSNISDSVKASWDAGNKEQRMEVCHIVLPNDEYDPKKLDSKYKKFKSAYYEKGKSEDKILSEKGYDYFPVLAPRWEVVGDDDYGTQCCGMICIGDVKQLQAQEEDALQALAQKVRPSMIGPSSLKNVRTSTRPGDTTYEDMREGSLGFRRLFEIDFQLSELENKQAQIRERIKEAYYVNLFLMLANSDRRQITAREIDERHEEKLLALGPVLERINQDLLDPLIENTFLILNQQGVLPEPPEELEGTDYRIEYISVMAQAQKLAGIGNIERAFSFAARLSEVNPELRDKLNGEEAIEDFADLTNLDPRLVKSKEEMEALRQFRQQQQAQQQQAEQAAQMVAAGKTLSETSMDEGSALKELIG